MTKDEPKECVAFLCFAIVRLGHRGADVSIDSTHSDRKGKHFGRGLRIHIRVHPSVFTICARGADLRESGI